MFWAFWWNKSACGAGTSYHTTYVKTSTIDNLQKHNKFYHLSENYVPQLISFAQTQITPNYTLQLLQGGGSIALRLLRDLGELSLIIHSFSETKLNALECSPTVIIENWLKIWWSHDDSTSSISFPWQISQFLPNPMKNYKQGRSPYRQVRKGRTHNYCNWW